MESPPSTTTVRVRATTRDAIRRIGEERAQTADTVIREALRALEWRDLRERAAQQARVLRDDPREQRLAREVARDLDEISAW